MYLKVDLERKTSIQYTTTYLNLDWHCLIILTSKYQDMVKKMHFEDYEIDMIKEELEYADYE